MVKFLSLLPIALALRSKRQATDVIIENARDAFTNFVTSANTAGTHGCHCARFSLGSAYGGAPLDDRDRACKSWNSARLCLELSGGACANDSTAYTWSGSCASLTNACHRAVCEIDQAFAAEINASTTAVSVVGALESTTRCPVIQENPGYDFCCGNSPDTYQKYNSERSRCYNGVVVITENCPAGQQKNNNDVCEDCPADTYSNGRGRCVTCNEVADIVVLYDGSGSMRNNEEGTSNTKWWHQKQFIKNLVDNFTIGANNVRVGAMQYNKNIKTNWNLVGGDTSDEVTTKTNDISQHDTTLCGTCSQFAKGYANFDDMFDHSPRADAKKVALIIADGLNGSNQSGIDSGLEWMKNNDVEVFFVRVGTSDNIGGKTWADLVEYEDNFMITGAAGWSGLDDVATKMKNKICAANAQLNA